MRGLLETFGLVLGKGSGGRFAVLVEEALASRPFRFLLLMRDAIEPLLVIWRATRAAAAAMHRQLRAMATADADCRRLMTTPLQGLLALSLSGIGSKASWPSMASARSPVGLPRGDQGGLHGPARAPWPSPVRSTIRRASTTAGRSAPTLA